MKLLSKLAGATGGLTFALAAFAVDAGILGNVTGAVVAHSTPAAATAAKARGTFALGATAYSVNQGAGTITVSVTRTGGSDGIVTVNFTTADNTAVAGVDYTAASGTLTWADGDAAVKSITVPVSNATPYTGKKYFRVTLSAPRGGARLPTPRSTVVTISGSKTNTSGTTSAAKLAALLGKPGRLLIGLGTNNNPSDIISQGLKPDIYDRYLSNTGPGSWTTYNSPAGAYAGLVASDADSVGAVPMFTLYQMATNGDGNLGSINDATFMRSYWSSVNLMYQQLASYGKPALVNFEPDFWGYVEQQSGGDPTKIAARVTIDADCASLPNDATGIAGCLILKARKYAPKAYVGFPPSDWASPNIADVAAFMVKLGATGADFIVAQTSDRDAGCFEAQAQNCTRTGSGWYWDESNATHPNFQDHLAEVSAFHNGIGGLPVLWWQTPLGVPSNLRGYAGHYRDNRAHYFLTHPGELTAVGGLGVVFSGGADQQTEITTDGGQYQSLSSQYLANPAPLP